MSISTSVDPASVRVLIIGAGIVGPLLALALKHTPKSKTTFDPIVFDAVEDWKEVGGGFILQPNGLSIFEHLGILEDVYKAGQPLDLLKVTDERGRKVMTVDMKSMYDKLYGKPQLGMKRHNLISAIMKHVQAENIPMMFGKRLVSVSQTTESVTATFEDGGVEVGDILIGCDGVRSATKVAVFGDSGPDLRWTGVEYVMGLTRDLGPEFPRHVNRSVVGRGLAVLVYGLSENESVWTIAYRTKMEPSRWEPQEDPKQTLEELNEKLKDGEFDEWVYSLTRNPHRVIRLGIRDRDPLESWSTGLVALAGDAAHPMMPDLGLGANCGLEDAGVISELLSRAVENPTASSETTHARMAGALKTYDEMRRMRAKEMVDANRVVARFVYVEGKVLARVRNGFSSVIMGLTKKLPQAKFFDYEYSTAVEKFLSAEERKRGKREGARVV
ncbi:hypothetical protein BJ742DRAFT_673119 [Cladochytrium replicatum]|nr:hypothetical protein BJ742DRAFT_673119 [Cladochytrium replicatum]